MSTIPPRSRAFLALSLLAVVAVILLPRMRPAEAPPALSSDCDLNAGPCLVRLDAARAVELSVTPRPLPVLKSLTLSLRTVGFAAPAAARIDFSGVGMDMGPNQANLSRVDADRLEGSGSLPVCVTGVMDWRADLQISLDDSAAPTRVALRFRAPLGGH